MSQENVEIARRAYDAFSRGDWPAFVGLMAPDVEFESLILEAEGGTYRGMRGSASTSTASGGCSETGRSR